MTFGLPSAIVELEMNSSDLGQNEGEGSGPMPLARVRVVIADDSRKAREGFIDLIGTWPEVELVGEASDGNEVLHLLQEREADVVLLDVRMPNLDGVTTAREIKARWPEVEVVVLSMYPYARGEALEAGASAFFVKGDSPQDLRAAIGRGSKAIKEGHDVEHN